MPTFTTRHGLAVLSGLVYSMAYPPVGWRWLVVPGIAGLLLALRGQSGPRARSIGFLHGMAAYAAGLPWLYRVFGWPVVVLWSILAVFTAVFAEMQGRAEIRGLTGWKFVAFTTLNWCGWEFIRAELFPLKFPWMTAGLAVGPNALLPWIGVYGAGILVVMAVALLVGRKWIAASLAFLLLVLATILTKPWPEPAGTDPLAVKVAGLQLENASLDAYLTGTREMDAGVQYVVWPEYAVPFDLQANRRDLELVESLCRERGITLTLGTQARPGGKAWRNIALTLDPTRVLGEHTKVHPVHFFDDGMPGKTAIPVLTRCGRVGTPICFDCDYEGVVRKMTNGGGGWFVVPTMDAESWTAREHDQHAELFRIRACENGRWMFICATSGVSQIIDPSGHVHARLAALQQGQISGIVRRESMLTFYTRWGWLTPWGALTLAIAGWILMFVPRKGGVSVNSLERPVL